MKAEIKLPEVIPDSNLQSDNRRTTYGTLSTKNTFINAQGLLHFDAHFRNILTDGHRLYFTDFGLAISARFELSESESLFFETHRDYDRLYTRTHLVNWLLRTLFGGENRDSLLQEFSEGRELKGIAPAIATIIRRDAPIAIIMNRFFQKFQSETRTAEFPVLEFALEEISHEAAF